VASRRFISREKFVLCISFFYQLAIPKEGLIKEFPNNQKFKTMPFGLVILIRVLFVACMVFIIGYVFGNFSKSTALTTITRVASILAIVLFISANIFVFRWGNWCNGDFNGRNQCGWYQRDTTLIK